jgi:geranylgeranyl diphosphate synthase type I
MGKLSAVEARMRAFFGAGQFAVLGPMIQEHLATGGKRLRARLALEAAAALGCQDDAAAMAWAGACELMHNATLVHDDLQDGDTVRRGAPTLWVSHGSAQAINAGDLMLMAPFALVRQAPMAAHLQAELCGVLAQGMLQVIEGQAQECAMTAAGFGDISGYTAMVRGKTAALFALPILGAAVLSPQGGAAPKVLADSFVPLGELFQMQDDVLDLWGDKGRGVVGSDLYEGKISALVAYHLAQSPGDGPWLSALLRKSREHTTAQDVAEAKARFERSGALDTVLARIGALARQAQEQVDGRLGALMEDLVQQVMAPIAHVRAPAPIP